jgi:hypothetical protein
MIISGAPGDRDDGRDADGVLRIDLH